MRQHPSTLSQRTAINEDDNDVKIQNVNKCKRESTSGYVRNETYVDSYVRNKE